MKGLKKLFNRVSTSLFLSASLAFGAASAEYKTPVSDTLKTTAPESACAAFPDFKKPEIPMHRISRNIEPDAQVQEKQELLEKISLSPGRPDGRPGMATRMAEREFLIFYGPLYTTTTFDRSLEENDLHQLRNYATQTKKDAQHYNLTDSTAAALRLASERTGVSLEKLATAAKTKPSLFKLENTTWLYLVKTHGATYGLDFYTGHITLKKQPSGIKAQVDNPFVHRQILDLRNNKRLSALLAAEYLKNQDALPQLAPPDRPAFDARIQKEQKALLTLGFNIGSTKADGIKGTMTDIALRQFQALYGEGAVTGALTEAEHKTLIAAAARARKEETLYTVPAAAVGAVRMASDKNNIAFGYMMELAETESAFAPSVKAKTSSATGLYQFIESTWHGTLKTYGHKYGLGAFADEIEIFKDDYGRDQARIANPLLRSQVIEMRKHPHLSSLLSTDFQLENRAKEQCYIKDKPLTRTDMYIAHFLGAHDAVYFIDALQKNGEKSAVDTFPEAAEYNIGVFYDTKSRKIRQERSLAEVYDFFDEKFNRGVYDTVPEKKKPRSPGS